MPNAVQTSALLVVLFVCLVPRVGLAQDQAAAEALFRSARKAAAAGDWVTACDRFEESHRLDPAPGASLNLGRCREKLGHLARAWKSYAEAAQRLPAGDNRASFARRKAAELEERVPRVTLHPPDTDENYRVTVSGTEFERASLGVSLPFDPGTLSVVMTAEGREEYSIELFLEEGTHIEHQLRLGETLDRDQELSEPFLQPLDAPEPVSAQSNSLSGRKKAAIAVWGAGGLAVVVGVGGGLWAASELPLVRQNCSDGRCDRTGIRAAKRGRIAVALGTAGGAVAVVGGALGWVLWSGGENAISLDPVSSGLGLSFRSKL